jgi:hypothetical protein
MIRINPENLVVKMFRLCEGTGLMVLKRSFERLCTKCQLVRQSTHLTFRARLATVLVFLTAIAGAGIVTTSLLHFSQWAAG